MQINTQKNHSKLHKIVKFDTSKLHKIVKFNISKLHKIVISYRISP